jgi:hypothetical protein
MFLFISIFPVHLRLIASPVLCLNSTSLFNICIKCMQKKEDYASVILKMIGERVVPRSTSRSDNEHFSQSCVSLEPSDLVDVLAWWLQ